MFINTIVSHCAKIVFSQYCRDVKNEVFEKKIAFFVFVFSMLETEKQKKEKQNGKRPKNPIQIVFFLRWSSKKEKIKKGSFAKYPDTICVRKGETTRIFVHTICFSQKFFGQQ